MKSRRRKELIFIFSFLCIPVLLLTVFTYYPATKLVHYSFVDWDGISPDMEFIGLKNYKYILTDSKFYKMFSSHSIYFLMGIIQNVLALMLAIILNKKTIKGRNIFRVIILMPFVLNGTAISFMFQGMYDFEAGVINVFLQSLGLPAVRWFSEALVNISLALIYLWRGLGYTMVLYLGGLQSIPMELYDSAAIDGATGWKSVWYVVLPQLKKIIELQLFLNVSGAINIFDVPYVVTSGGPNEASYTLALRSTELAFQYNKYGRAAAYGVILTVIVVVLYWIQKKLVFRKED